MVSLVGISQLMQAADCHAGQKAAACLIDFEMLQLIAPVGFAA